MEETRIKKKRKKEESTEHSSPHDRRNYNKIHCVKPQMAKSIIVQHFH